MTKRLEEWQRDAVRAVGDNLVRDIVRDSYRGPSRPSSLASLPGVPDEAPRPASGGTAELKVQGINYVDAVAQSFEQQERLEALIKQRALVRELVGDVANKEDKIPDPKP
jgi:hypothetical protein